MIPDYPSNSETSKRRAEEQDKDLKRVTTSEPTRRPRSLRKRFAGTFIQGNSKTAMQYVVLDVMIPAAQEMVSESVRAWVDKLMFGDTRRRGAPPPTSGATGYVNYGGQFRHAMSRYTAPERVLSRRARARHDFDELVLDSRAEAEEVIDQMIQIVSRY